MKKTDPVIVYWSPYSNPDRVSYVNMLCKPPKRVLTSFAKPLTGESSRTSAYHGCPALHNLMKNTFMIPAPLSASAKLTGPFSSSFINSDVSIWNQRVGATSGIYSIDYDFSWVFFSEEPVTIRITHPYMHNTSFSRSGYLTSGSFEIDKWFRPINITFNLWDGVDTVSVVEGEPLAYIELETEDGRPVMLKQFELTSDMYSYCNQALIMSKNVIPFQTLEELYDRFIGSNRHKKLSALVKAAVL